VYGILRELPTALVKRFFYILERRKKRGEVLLVRVSCVKAEKRFEG
jgi:hypothetical protein